MKHNPYKIVKMFEEEVANYTGALWAVSTDSCTDALLLCCEYLQVEKVTIPARTYLSVPQSIMHAGGTVDFEDIPWKGIYQLNPIQFMMPQNGLLQICISLEAICVYLFILRNI